MFPGVKPSTSLKGQNHLTMPGDGSVKVFRAINELEEVRAAWETWPGNRDSEMESYLDFLQANPSILRPHVIVVYRSGQPDAMLVGRIDKGKVVCRLGYFHLDLPARTLCFVYGAFRGSESLENSTILVASVMESLRDGEADVAYMNFLREDSDLFRQSVAQPSLFCRDYARIRQPHFAIKLPGSAEEYHKGLSSNARWQAKSKQKKLMKDFAGDVEVRCFKDKSEVEILAQDAERIAKMSYQRGLGVGFADSPSMRDALRLKAERGWLRAYVLYLGKKPAAFWIGDINGATFGSDFLAYDTEFAKYSPGMFLIVKVIEGFCDAKSDGVTTIDFATGHAQYKEALSNEGWQEIAVNIFAPTAKGMLLNLVRSSVGWIDQIAKNVLARTTLLNRIKKAWRNHAKPKQAMNEVS